MIFVAHLKALDEAVVEKKGPLTLALQASRPLGKQLETRGRTLVMRSSVFSGSSVKHLSVAGSLKPFVANSRIRTYGMVGTLQQ